MITWIESPMFKIKNIKIHKTLYNAAQYIYPYIKLSYDNIFRTFGVFSSIFLVPLVSTIIPYFFLKMDEQEGKNSNNLSNGSDHDTAFITQYIGFAIIVAVQQGMQQGINQYLQVSITQAVRKDNIRKLLTQDATFLMHGDLSNIKSIQYTTIGEGVRDYAKNTVPVITTLPAAVISSLATIAYSSIYTKSSTVVSYIIGFSTSSFIIVFGLSRMYSNYLVNNQKIENDLVGKINFIEANKIAIPLMGVSEKEYQYLLKNLAKVDSSIYQLYTSYLFYFLFNSAATILASKFFGVFCDNNNTNSYGDYHHNILNIMMMALSSNINTAAIILSNHLPYIELHLDQLMAYKKSYDNHMIIMGTHNKVVQKFQGDHISLSDVTIYRPNIIVETYSDIEFRTLFKNITLQLESGKIYKIHGHSGAGKTTFLKSIVNQWPYAEGSITMPEWAKDHVYFIPQHSFISKGTLLDILTYRLPSGASVEHEVLRLCIKNTDIVYDQNRNTDNKKNVEHVVDINDKINGTIITLLKAFRLLPNTINENELVSSDVNWSERLSGGEKQKINILQVMLANANIIIMDESTSALDHENKNLVYNFLKEYAHMKENCIILYTDHSTSDCFADNIINICGDTLILES